MVVPFTFWERNLEAVSTVGGSGPANELGAPASASAAKAGIENKAVIAAVNRYATQKQTLLHTTGTYLLA
jgi:hypothetical protein